MSIKIMSAVWDEPDTKGSERLVLLALADNANDEGFCWPSLETIARKCNISRRFVVRLLDSLEERGLVERERRTLKGMYTSTMYRVIVHKVVKPSSPHGTPAVVTPSTLPCEPQYTTPSEAEFTTVVNPSSLKPPINHQLEPPSNSGAAPKYLTDPAAERIYQEVTGNMAFPASSRETDIDRIRKVYMRYGDGTTEYLKPYWAEWRDRDYSKANTSWLDWATSGDVPKRKNPKRKEEKFIDV